MKKLYNRILIVMGLLFAASCSVEDVPVSRIQNFMPYSPVLASTTPALVVPEIEGESTHTFHFNFDNSDRQITGVTITPHAGPSSTAKEGEDFEILTHDIEFDALEGSDGFDVEIVVYPDYVEEGDETIFLTFTTSVPSGLDKTETKVITIQDWPICAFDLTNIEGPREGTDVTIDGLGFDPYLSEVVISNSADGYTIRGLGVGWMTDFWGEVITDMQDVVMEIEENDYVGVITIPEQEYMTTTYNGDPQDVYLIEGTGVIHKCNKQIIIEYTLSNNGTDWAAWTHNNGYMSEEKFTAVLTLP